MLRGLLRVALAITLGHPSARAEAGPPGAAVIAEQKPQVVPPTPVSRSEPTYPEGAAGDAAVALELVVAADGRVRSAVALEANEPFSSRAVAAAQLWLFSPARRGAEPVAARIRVEVIFRDPVLPSALSDAPMPVSGAASTPPPPPPVEVVVQGEASEAPRSGRLSRAEVRQLPGAFGDAFRAIEVLPGVAPIVSGLPFFFVRGSPPGNVGYFVDDVRLPLLFHVGAGPSVVHPAFIGRVDLYPGGYPAQLGRYSGGVVHAESAPPSLVPRAEYNLRLFDAGGFVEAPLLGGKADVAVAGRYSFAGWLLSLFTDGVVRYGDYQARLGYTATARDRLEVFALGASDYVGQKTKTRTKELFRASFRRLRVSHWHRVNDGQLRTSLVAGVDETSVESYGEVADYTAAARSQLDLRLAEGVALRTGIDLSIDRYRTELNRGVLSPSAAQIAAAFSSRTEVAMGAHVDFPLRLSPRFQMTPGLRVDLFGSYGATAVGVDPRLRTRLELSRRVALLGAFGVAHQPPAFATTAPGIQPSLQGGLQRAIQESAALELSLDEATLLTVTAFYDAFMNMSDALSSLGSTRSGCTRGRFDASAVGGDPSGAPFADSPDCGPRFASGTLGPDASGGRGQAVDTVEGRRATRAFEARTLGAAYGVELFMKRRMTRRLSGILSYTLSRSVRSQGRQSYVATFDRSHVLNVAVSYDLGGNWRVGSRLLFYTGVPAASDAPGSPARLSPFVRLDARVEKRWQLGRSAWLAFVAEWLNATLSHEAVATRCTPSGCEEETIGPLTIPSIGVEGGF